MTCRPPHPRGPSFAFRPLAGLAVAASLATLACTAQVSGDFATGGSGPSSSSGGQPGQPGSGGTGGARPNGSGGAGASAPASSGGSGVPGTGSSMGSGGTGIGGTGIGGSGGAAVGTGGMVVVSLPPSALPVPDKCTSNAPGPRRVRRLTANEFAASVKAIFGDANAAVPVTTVFSDPQMLGFSVDASALLVQGLNASQLMDNAESVAGWAATNNKLSQFGNCSTVDADCAKKFIKAFGRRAFRTTLADADPKIAGYQALFMGETSFAAGAQAVVAAMLQSPHFVYRTEVGVQSGAEYALTPAEVASSLAYLLTGNMPDDMLLSAADSVASGSMTMTAMIDQQAQRLIGSSQGTAVMGFMSGWLGFEKLYTTAKDDSVFMMTKSLRDAMAAETRGLVMDVFNGNGGLNKLFTADYSFLNKELADFYGIPANGLGTSTARVMYSSTTPRDPGLLAHGTVLNSYARPEISSPTQRGYFVRRRLMCQDVPPPPANLDTVLKPMATTAKTTRQRYEDVHDMGVCYACHRLMDQVGFGFERYDGFGRRRDTENGVAIDARGTVYEASLKDGHVAFNGLGGPGSLSAYLGGSDDVQKCMIRHWTYYSYGATSWPQDACTYDAVYQEAAKGSFALRSVLMAILHAPTFTRRVQDK